MLSRFAFVLIAMAVCAMSAAPPVYAGHIVSVVSGAEHIMYLKDDGSVWTNGDNTYGGVASGFFLNMRNFINVVGPTDTKAISSNGYHCMALQRDGSVWMWGNNSCGQIDSSRSPWAQWSGVTADLHWAVHMPGMSGVTAVSAGAAHSLVLKSDGTVWAWGLNDHGQLGIGSTTSTSVPTQVFGLSDVVAISAGGYHSVAIKSDGTVWAWGQNQYGQLGDGTTLDNTVPVQVRNAAGIVSISAGKYHNLGLKSDGTVVAWGQNFFGQVGNSVPAWSGGDHVPVPVAGLSNITAVSAGSGHSAALKNDGTVWVWGDNSKGQLGAATTQRCSFTPLQVPGVSNVARMSAGGSRVFAAGNDDSVMLWGYSANKWVLDTRENLVRQANGINGVAKLDAGWNATVAVKGDGTLWLWGRNDYGQLGNGSTSTSLLTPTQSNITGVSEAYYSSRVTLALKFDGTLWAAGDNSLGCLGDGTTTSRKVFGRVGSLTGVVKASAGQNHGVALTSDGSVWCWGKNSRGEIGNGAESDSPVLSPTQVNISEVVDVAAGYSSTIALKSDGSVWQWGYNYGTAPVPTGITGVVAISSAYFNNAALKADGTIAVWRTAGPPLPSGSIAGTGIIAVSAGYNHFDYVKSDGSAWHWDNWSSGPTRININDAVGVASGAGYSEILKSDGTVWGFGINDYGQLGCGFTNLSVLPQSAALAISADSRTGFSVDEQTPIQSSSPLAAQDADGRVNPLAVGVEKKTATNAQVAAASRVWKANTGLSVTSAISGEKLSRKTDANGNDIQFYLVDRRDSAASQGVQSKTDADTESERFLTEHASELGISDEGTELTLINSASDSTGMTTKHYQQSYKGVPVHASDFLVHLGKDGRVKWANGGVLSVAGTNTTPSLDVEKAVDIARSAWAKEYGAVEPELPKQPGLVIIDASRYARDSAKPKSNSRLCWEINLTKKSCGAWPVDLNYYVDAHNGHLWVTLSNIRTAVNRKVADCTPYSRPDGSGVCWINSQWLAEPYPGHYWGKIEGYVERPTNPKWGGEDVNEVFDYLGMVHRFCQDKFGLNGANNMGGVGPVGVPDSSSTINSRGVTLTQTYLDEIWGVGSGGCPNAGFGTSDLQFSFCHRMTQPDIVGHEYGHALEYYRRVSGNQGVMEYFDQSGALSEGFADFMAESFKYYWAGQTDWIHEATGPFPRSLANPSSVSLPSIYGVSGVFPDRCYNNVYCGRVDQHGVHINSTIVSHGFYLLAVGGYFNGIGLKGIGVDKADQLAMEAMRRYASNSSFPQAYAVLAQTAIDLWGAGSLEAAETAAAFQAVEMDQGKDAACYGVPWRQPTAFDDRPAIATGNATTSNPALQKSAGKHKVKLWGKVKSVNGNAFTIDDGSGPVNVRSYGSVPQVDKFVIVTGNLDCSSSTPVLQVHPSDIEVIQ